MKFLIVIGGPTGSGKTELAIRLARHFNTEILSADSRQFYREMSIGTAKPEPGQLDQARHHFVNSLSIHQAYSAGDFERDALGVLDEIFAKKDYAILTGGSGLFLKALCEGLDDFPEVPAAIREALEQLLNTHGISALQQMLANSDPDYYQEVDLSNPRRLIRALSVIRASGQPYSSFRVKNRAPRSFFPIYIELAWNRNTLYQRINQRVNAMIEKGLVQEVQALLPWKNLPALKTVGYQELFDYFEGACSFEVAVERVRQHSRNYAKRQLTWSRRDGYWKHFHPSEWDLILEYLHFSAQKLIFWQQKMLNEVYPGTMNTGQRLLINSSAGMLGSLDFEDGDHARVLLPSRRPETKEGAKWLLHEAIQRAAGKPVFALLGQAWAPLLTECGFGSAHSHAVGKKALALASRFPAIMPWFKEGADSEFAD